MTLVLSRVERIASNTGFRAPAVTWWVLTGTRPLIPRIVLTENIGKRRWVTLEVFNLLQVNNTISYIWIKDVYDRQYAIPNYLTPRQLNVKLIARF